MIINKINKTTNNAKPPPYPPDMLYPPFTYSLWRLWLVHPRSTNYHEQNKQDNNEGEASTEILPHDHTSF